MELMNTQMRSPGPSSLCDSCVMVAVCVVIV